MALSIDKRLRRLHRIHKQAKEFLYWIEQVFGHFDPQDPPRATLEEITVTDYAWQALSIFLHTCEEKYKIRRFPCEFSAVQSTPIEFCGITEPNSHAYVYRLTRQVFVTVCETIVPYSTPYEMRFDSERLEIPDCLDDADGDFWEPISKVLHTIDDGRTNLDWFPKLDRLRALMDQEYERAVDFVKRGAAHIPTKEIDKPVRNKLTIFVSQKPAQVTINGQAYALAKNGVLLMQALIDADGEWINGTNVVKQASRVRNQMPSEVRRYIESEPGKGFRLKKP